MEEFVRVAICGTSSTGKTTLAKAMMADPRVNSVLPNFVGEGAREFLQKEKITLEQMSLKQRRDFQRRYLVRKREIDANINGNTLFDRSLVDVAAIWVERDAPNNEKLQQEFLIPCERLVSYYSALIFIPFGKIPFQRDGVRIDDIELHRRIGVRIKSLLDEWQLPYGVIESTKIEERVDEAVALLRRFGIIPQA